MILSISAIGKSASFVLTNENVEEIRREDVKVSFGNELEKILLAAVEDGDVQFLKEVFSKEVCLQFRKSFLTSNFQVELLQNLVRKRAFDYIEDGVHLSGSDVEAAKDVVDRIKVTQSLSESVSNVQCPSV